MHNCNTKSRMDLRLVWHSRLARTWLNLTCQLSLSLICPIPMDSHIDFIAIVLGKLSKSLTSLANVYSSSTTPVVLGLFDNCCMCSIRKEKSIPAIKLFLV